MFGIDPGQPGSFGLPDTLDPRHTVGSAGYATWAERTRLLTAATESVREARVLTRERRRAQALRRRADRAEVRLHRLEAAARAH